MEFIEHQYEVIVRRTSTTRKADASEPKVETKTVAEFKGGPEETATVLTSLASQVRGAKKALGFANVVKAVSDSLKEQDEKAKAKGEPTLGETIGLLLNGNKKPGSTTSR